MNKNFIIHNLTDAFEVLKDLWDTRKEAICRCITGMVKQDSDIAMDMWLYIINSHRALIQTEEGCKAYIDSVCDSLYCDIGDGLYEGATKAVYKSIFKNKDLYSSLYGEAFYSVDLIFQPKFCEYCLAWYMAETKPDNLMDVLLLLSKNANMKGYTMGLVITRAISFLRIIERTLSKQSQGIIMSCIEYVEDKNDRAEITIAALS